MNIGIITFWWTQENYGQILQLYAIYEYICSQGHSVEIIRFIPNKKSNIILQFLRNKSILQQMSFLSKGLRRVLSNYKLIKQRKSFPRQFDAFRQKYLKFTESRYSSIQELRSYPPNVDVYICGSDQIWNYLSPTLIGFETLDVYTAQFGVENTKRISYAASFGFSGINKVVLKKLIANLSSFQGISVREINARDVLTEYGARAVQVVPDPTLLLHRDKYLELIDQNTENRLVCPEFLVYVVQNKSVFSLEDIIYLLKEHKVSYFATGANNVVNSNLNFFPTIQEWLYTMKESGTIITNSFHGCVFSILFHKNFYYYPLLPNAQGHVDSRIDSLLARFGIEGRAITTEEQLSSVIANPYKPIDWDSVDAKREEFVQVGKDFLAKHLGDATT